MSDIELARRTLGLEGHVDHGLSLDVISTLLSTRWFWILQGLIIVGAALSGWLLARASRTDPAKEPLLPQYSHTRSSRTYAHDPTTGPRDVIQDNTRTLALQTQLRNAKDRIAALEAGIAAQALRRDEEYRRQASTQSEVRQCAYIIYLKH